MSGAQALIYLLAGDSFLTERKYQAVLETLRKKISGGEVAVQSYRLSETPLDRILGQARNLPFLAAAQVFRLQDAEVLKSASLEMFAQYLERPSPSSYLIFESPSLGKGSDLAGLIAKKAEMHFFEPEEKRSAGGRLIQEKLRRAGKTMTNDALSQLEEQAGEEPAFLDSLIDQLINYAGSETQITQPMVETFEENWENTEAFSLTDALAAQKTSQALILSKKLLAGNERDLISLIGLLHWQMRRYWQARVLIEDGVPESEILKKCRISFKQAPYFMRQVRGFSRLKLEKALEGLFQLDWKIKTGRVDGPVGLESWIISF